MSRAKKIVGVLAVSVVGLVVVLAVAVRLTTYHPGELEPAPLTCGEEAPVLKRGQPVKILSWNVQYMAGKNYVFYYDILDGSGPDTRPTRKDIDATTAEVARVILEEDPDIVLLQEMDDGAARTDGEDQHAILLGMLKEGRYVCHAQAFYWKAGFVPHPKIMGAVGLKFSMFSRYKIERAERRALPLLKQDPLTDQFYIKRAVLETVLPLEGSSSPGGLVVMNTHLDAFAQGTDTMERQVEAIRARLDKLESLGVPWVIGGDFNLLPPGESYERLGERQRAYYKPKTELESLYKSFHAVPSLEEVQGPDYKLWWTHWPNDPDAGGLDRTIDYIFASKHVKLGEHKVRHGDALRLSDHMPVIATVTP
jgi:endonuclease/exonuclease/phosphatase family metal-dependent hydrolase